MAAKALSAWRSNAEAKRAQRDLLCRAATTLLNSRVARALRRWREHAGRSAALCAKAAQVVQLMRYRQQVGVRKEEATRRVMPFTMGPCKCALLSAAGLPVTYLRSPLFYNGLSPSFAGGGLALVGRLCGAAACQEEPAAAGMPLLGAAACAGCVCLLAGVAHVPGGTAGQGGGSHAALAQPVAGCRALGMAGLCGAAAGEAGGAEVGGWVGGCLVMSRLVCARIAAYFCR